MLTNTHAHSSLVTYISYAHATSEIVGPARFWRPDLPTLYVNCLGQLAFLQDWSAYTLQNQAARHILGAQKRVRACPATQGPKFATPRRRRRRRRRYFSGVAHPLPSVLLGKPLTLIYAVTADRICERDPTRFLFPHACAHPRLDRWRICSFLFSVIDFIFSRSLGRCLVFVVWFRFLEVEVVPCVSQ